MDRTKERRAGTDIKTLACAILKRAWLDAKGKGRVSIYDIKRAQRFLQPENEWLHHLAIIAGVNDKLFIWKERKTK